MNFKLLSISIFLYCNINAMVRSDSADIDLYCIQGQAQRRAIVTVFQKELDRFLSKIDHGAPVLATEFINNELLVTISDFSAKIWQVKEGSLVQELKKGESCTIGNTIKVTFGNNGLHIE